MLDGMICLSGLLKLRVWIHVVAICCVASAHERQLAFLAALATTISKLQKP